MSSELIKIKAQSGDIIQSANWNKIIDKLIELDVNYLALKKDQEATEAEVTSLREELKKLLSRVDSTDTNVGTIHEYINTKIVPKVNIAPIVMIHR